MLNMKNVVQTKSMTKWFYQPNQCPYMSVHVPVQVHMYLCNHGGGGYLLVLLLWLGDRLAIVWPAVTFIVAFVVLLSSLFFRLLTHMNGTQGGGPQGV